MLIASQAQIDGELRVQGLLYRLFAGGEDGLLHLLADLRFDVAREARGIDHLQIPYKIARVMKRPCMAHGNLPA